MTNFPGRTLIAVSQRRALGMAFPRAVFHRENSCRSTRLRSVKRTETVLENPDPADQDGWASAGAASFFADITEDAGKAACTGARQERSRLLRCKHFVYCQKPERTGEIRAGQFIGTTINAVGPGIRDSSHVQQMHSKAGSCRYSRFWRTLA